MALSCPESGRISALLLAQLPAEEIEPLAQHLEQCNRCGETLDQLLKQDTLVDAMRGQATVLDVPSSPAVEALLTRLRGSLPPTSETTDSTVPANQGDESFDFLAPAQAADEIGRLGPYRVLKVLGAGGMGVVFQAEDPHLERIVALKVMKPGIANSQQARERFMREAKATAKVKNDHIITIYQVGEDRGAPYLAMEFLKGESLEQWLQRGRRLSPAQTLRMAREMANGLAAAHAHGLIHRDIKPGNIWLEAPNGRTKILDFGLARQGGAGEIHLTQSGAIVGTPAYMAPEQARAEPLDHRCDLFSLGCVLYRMTTGQMPFKGDTAMALLTALALDSPTPVHELNPSLSRSLSDLIMRLLAKKPADRPASAKALLADLQAIERERTTSSQTAPVAVPVAKPIPQVKASDLWADLTLPQPSKAATPQPAPTNSAPRPKRRLLIAAGLLLLFAGIGFGIYQLTYQTPHGTLVVEIDDKNVEARFKSGELKLYDAKGELKYTLKPSEKNKDLPPGEYRIEVAGADGLKLDTDKFEMRKDDKVTVRVRMETKAVAGKPLASPAADADRATAEYVLKHGGMVALEGREGWITEPAKLPAGALKLIFIHITLQPGTLDDLLTKLRPLTGLRNMGLDCINVELTDDDLQRLANEPVLVSALENFQVTGPHITDAGLAHIKRFRALGRFHVHSPAITDAGLKQVRECPGINGLGIEGRQITDAGLRELRGAKVRNLFLVGTAITDAGLEHLRELPLEGLQIANGSIGDAGCTTLGRLTSLERLDLAGLSITDAGVARLNGLKNLKSLSLRNAKGITDAGLTHLTRLQALENLHIDNTAVTDAGLEHLKLLPNLKVAQLTRNKVTVEGLRKLAAALPMCRVESEDGKLWPGQASLADKDKPFIVLGKKASARQEFQFLWQAVEKLREGDVIEIHGNGPFPVAPIKLENPGLTLRAAPGYRPELRLEATVQVKNAPLRIEGCDLRCSRNGAALVVEGAPGEIRGCRLTSQFFNGPLITYTGPGLTIDNCVLASSHYTLIGLGGGSQLHMTNNFVTTLTSQCIYANSPGGQTIHLRDNILLAGIYHGVVTVNPGCERLIEVHAEGNVLRAPPLAVQSAQVVGDWTKRVRWDGKNNLYWARMLAEQPPLPGKDKTRGLAGWNTIWGHEEPGSRELPEIRFAWEEWTRQEPSAVLADVRRSIEAAKKEHAKKLGEVGPEWDLVGPGEAYVRALEKRSGQPLRKEQLRPAPTAEGPFVLLRDNKEVRTFSVFVDAVNVAQSGDVIEIRKDGPFALGKPQSDDPRRITVRAAPGYLPILDGGVTTAHRWAFEGITFRNGKVRTVTRLLNCAFDSREPGASFGGELQTAGDKTAVIENSQLDFADPNLNFVTAAVFRNCLLGQTVLYAGKEPRTVRLERCVVWSPNFRSQPAVIHDIPEKIFTLEATGTWFEIGGAEQLSHHLGAWRGENNVYRAYDPSLVETLRTTWKSEEKGSVVLPPFQLDANVWRLVGTPKRADGKDYGAEGKQ
jgi:serine/threonine protein kinase